MAESPVNVTSLTTGVPIAAELCTTPSTTAFVQQIKVLGSATGSIVPIPADGQGLWVQIAGSTVPQVGVSSMPAVSGTVTVLGSVQVSGIAPVTTAASVSVTGLPVWLNPTQTVVASNFSTVVSGTVSVSGTAIVSVVPGVSVTIVGLPVTISGITPVTTQTSVSISGLPVWFNAGALVSVSGTAVVSVVPGLSVTIVGLPVTISGIVPVTTAASVSVSGLPVWLNPTQSVNIGSIVSTVLVNIVAGAAGGGSVTTAPPSISQSGQAVWMVGGQSTTANPVFVSQINPPAAGGGSVVTTQAGGTSTGQLVWLATTQQMSVTVSGTAVVSIVPGVSVTIVGLPVTISGIVPVTTAASVSVSGVPVWLNPTQGILASIAVSQTIGTIVTILGTQVVSVVPGLSVTIVGLPVTISGIVPVTTAASVSVSGLPVWLSPTQGILASIAVSQTVGTIITLLGTVQISGTVNVSSTVAACIVAMPPALLTNSMPSASAQGLVVWAAGGQSTTAFPVYISQANPLVGGDIQAIVTTTAVSSSTQVLLQSVYVNGTVPGSTLGTSGWTVGAGSALMVYGLGFGWSQAAANMQATFMMMVTTSGTTLSTVSPAFAQVTFTTAAALSTVISSGFFPGTYHGINTSLTTIPFPWVIQGPAVVGFAVAATSSGATVYATVNAQVVNTIPYSIVIQTILGTAVVSVVPGVSVQASISGIVPVTTQTSVSVSGLPVWMNPTQQVAISGAVSAVTSQLNTTGAAVWLAPTQTMTVTIAAAVGVTTQTSVSVTGLPVWFQAGALVAISSIAGVTTQTSVSVTGLPVWFQAGASVTVVGQTVTIAGGSVSTTQPPSGVTGVKVWPGQPVNIPVMIMVTSTAIAQSATAYLMTVWTGSTVAAAGTSLYAVPAGQNLRLINNLGIVTTSAVVGGTVQMVIAFGTNAASLVSGSVRTQGMALLNQIVVASTNAVSANVAGQADIGAGATIAPFIIASTAAVLQNVVVNGFLF